MDAAKGILVHKPLGTRLTKMRRRQFAQDLHRDIALTENAPARAAIRLYADRP